MNVLTPTNLLVNECYSFTPPNIKTGHDQTPLVFVVVIKTTCSIKCNFLIKKYE